VLTGISDDTRGTGIIPDANMLQLKCKSLAKEVNVTNFSGARPLIRAFGLCTAGTKGTATAPFNLGRTATTRRQTQVSTYYVPSGDMFRIDLGP